ncbi:MAG: alpha/beta fold hydrolase [Clostridia bacterium]|nr:alpha/beta fold hydrolase [Clostridia bacterium]
MSWVITELHNMPLILCGIFYSVLCIFSLVTGLIYANGKKELNPLELSDKFMEKMSDEEKLKKFTVKMGWVTFVVGIVQGLTALAIFKGYNIFLNWFAIGFTIFSICSVSFKLKGKINAFPIIKLIFYVVILMILLLAGVRNYSATDEAIQYLESSENVKVSKIKEGYFFDGIGEETAMIFFPGARVQCIAYAKLMYKFAENGVDCFLLAEPLNLAFFAVYTPEKIMQKYDYENWYLSGHSLGGVIASVYASDKPEDVTGVIGLASYPLKKLPSNIEYIVFYGSEDNILSLEKFEESKKYLPDASQIYVIEGGNHSGFANYREQKGDGKAKITSNEQQDFVIQKILEYQK